MSNHFRRWSALRRTCGPVCQPIDSWASSAPHPPRYATGRLWRHWPIYLSGPPPARFPVTTERFCRVLRSRWHNTHWHIVLYKHRISDCFYFYTCIPTVKPVSCSLYIVCMCSQHASSLFVASITGLCVILCCVTLSCLPFHYATACCTVWLSICNLWHNGSVLFVSLWLGIKSSTCSKGSPPPPMLRCLSGRRE